MSMLTSVLTAPYSKTPRRLRFASSVLNTFFTRHFSALDVLFMTITRPLLCKYRATICYVSSVNFVDFLDFVSDYPGASDISYQAFVERACCSCCLFLSLGADTYHVRFGSCIRYAEGFAFATMDGLLAFA
jgi:hypothetical protein